MKKKLKKLIIIGGGQFGILVSKIVQKSKEFNIIGFIDNDEKLENFKRKRCEANLLFVQHLMEHK